MITHFSGDSGGPLVLAGKFGPTLIGVVSAGIGCGRKQYPGVYAYVGAVRLWIDKSIQCSVFLI